jgi:hypothetical protein
MTAIAGTTLGTIAVLAVAFKCPRAAAVFGAVAVGWTHTAAGHLGLPIRK